MCVEQEYFLVPTYDKTIIFCITFKYNNATSSKSLISIKYNIPVIVGPEDMCKILRLVKMLNCSKGNKYINKT